MVQTIKAYKCMKTTLKAYKSNMGTNHKSYISMGTKQNIITKNIITKEKYNHQSIVTMTKNIYKL